MRVGSRWLASPALGFVAVMVGGPMAVIIWYSLRTRGPGGVGVGDGLTTDAYERLAVSENFTGDIGFDPTYLQVMWSSILLAAVTMLVALVIGFPTAVWISNRPRHLQPLLILAVTIPFWTSMLVRTYAWIVILRETGPLASALDAIAVDAPQMLNTRGATLIGMAYTFLPFMILPIYAAAERFDHRIAEAGLDLGATPGVVLRRIVWPSVRPGVIAGCLLVFIPAIGAFLQPELLGGGRSLMIANLIQQQFGASRNWPFGSALAILLLVVVGTVLVTARRAAQGAQVVLS
ncbi:ABC transporter permease [Candidatus Poriferisodalis sp.]|uniref:ABC transporter permease n=1 Tax=Candidatus Poriferisodalis sp. TaxID=3101277 RepID=UPI003B5CD4F2